MNARVRRRFTPRVRPLESRTLLTILANYAEQDGSDKVGRGRGNDIQGDDFQDLHVILTNLPTDKQIIRIDVSRLDGNGGGTWLNPPDSQTDMVIERVAGSSRADIYLDPGHPPLSPNDPQGYWFNDCKITFNDGNPPVQAYYGTSTLNQGFVLTKATDYNLRVSG